MATGETDALNDLLKRMPEIAKAVSAFPEGVQQAAFDALITAASGGGAAAPPASGESTAKPARQSRNRKRPAASDGDGAAKRQRRVGGSPSVIRELDLAPKGKMSLKDFVAAKQPKTQHDYNVLSVYYLVEELGVPTVTLNHVFTVYKDMRWREPSDLGNSVSLTSVRKRFLDTSNRDDIKLTPAGRNHVQYDLPAKPKGK